MSDTSCAKCGDVKGSCATPATTKTVQNGKGDAPRNISRSFRSNFDSIKWGSSSSKNTSKTTKSSKTAKTAKKKSSR